MSKPAIAAVMVAALLLAAACTAQPASPDTAGPVPAPVTLTWWHRGESAALEGLWAQVAEDFERLHPHVTVGVSAQPGPLDVSTVPEGERPDLVEVSGGAELMTAVLAGEVMDVTDLVGPERGLVGAAAAAWTVNERQYGLPYSMGIDGFWYRKSLFAQAGITAVPTTLAELAGVADRLRASGIIPMVVRTSVGWPATHYWQYFALRDCDAGELERSVVDRAFSDPCFVKAGEDLAALIATQPFQPGFDSRGGPVQGVESESALLVRGAAAMELAGPWYPAFVDQIAADAPPALPTIDAEAVRADLGWFPFPSVPGGRGDPGAVLGSGGGFACSAQAPPECVELLKFSLSDSVQSRYADVGDAVPALRAAAAGRYPAELLAAQYGSGQVQPSFDVACGPTVGAAMTDSVLELFSGQASPQSVMDAMNAAGH